MLNTPSSFSANKLAPMMILPKSSLRAKTHQDTFEEDMIRCFQGEGGGVGYYGYVGLGGQLYSQWLRANHLYRGQVTLAEIELMTHFAGDLSRLVQHPVRYLQMGASGSRGVYFTKIYPFVRALLAMSASCLEYYIADISEDFFHDNVHCIQELGLPVLPQYVPGNFYASLNQVRNMDIIHIPGITFENPPFDLLTFSTEEVLRYQLSYFRRALNKRGMLLFSFASPYGIDGNGSELKALYDDPYIHAYQKTIFTRVKNELHPTGHYDDQAFHIYHQWHPDRYVLARHAKVNQAMCFNLGRQTFSWGLGHSLYLANFVRYPEAMIVEEAKKAGFVDCHILQSSSNLLSNMRLAAIVNA